MSRLAALAPNYRKFLVALAGVLVQLVLFLQDLVASGLLHGKALAGVQVALALLTAFGVRQASNVDTDVPDPVEMVTDESRRPSPHRPEHAAPED